MAWARVKIGDGEWIDFPQGNVATQPARVAMPTPSEYQECGGCTQKKLQFVPRTFVEPEDATFVWVYWHGGAKADELRWSIRSVVKHYHGNASILVVGDPPPWYTGPAIRMDRVGPCRMRRYRDQLDKFYAVCRSSAVPESFVWMMDDTMFAQPVSMADLRRNFFFGSVPAKIGGKGEWLDHKRETFAVLAEHGYPQVDYCTHMPHVLEKSKFLATWDKFDLGNRTLQWELLYGAMHWRNRERIDPQVFAFLRRGFKGEPTSAIINHADKGWTPSLHSYLQRRFYAPSPVEAAVVKPLRVEARMRTGLVAFIAALPDGPLMMAEVGSYAGESVEIFAASGKFSEVHCVDSWATFAGKGYRTSEAEPRFDAVLARFPKVIRKHKFNSLDGANLFYDGYFDLVYIDASHDYASVRADIAAWRRTVKLGGFVCGHDYCLRTPGVTQAVREALGDYELRLFQDDSWMVRV
jgi:hypothetical protein